MNDTGPVPRTAWTIGDLAVSMGVNYRTVLKWVHAGDLAAFQVGSRGRPAYRVSEDARARYVAEAEAETRIALGLGDAESA